MSSGSAAEPSLEGHYAGAVTRFGAAVTDVLLSLALFAVGSAFVTWLVNLFFGVDLESDHRGWGWAVALIVWEFVYYWYCLSLSGKTPGCSLVGLRVVKDTGEDLDRVHAAIRVIFFPFSFLFFGIPFLGIVFGRRRRAFHDVVAGTGVVYDWDARAARLRFLAKRPASES
jgi:uncharacterized RDD family membrane protein YckC